MSKLTRAEKNMIIINESKGIQHPDYYVCHTKNGGVQVRKRKQPLNVGLLTQSTSQNIKTPIKENPTCDSLTEGQGSSNQDTEPKPPKETISYEAVTNKQLLEKMLLILEKNAESKNKDLNDPERERETEDNKQFIEGVKSQAEQLNINKEKQSADIKPNDNDISQDSKSLRSSTEPTNQPVINTSSVNNTNRRETRGRQLIQHSSNKTVIRKGRKLF
jgi:hypothetical protein